MKRSFFERALVGQLLRLGHFDYHGSRLASCALAFAGLLSSAVTAPAQTLVTPPLTPLQSWRNTNFGNPFNAGTGADDATPAGDGVPNLLKYALGADPFSVVDPDRLLIPTVQTSNAQPYLTLTINRGSRAADLAYRVEVSADRTNWVSGVPKTLTLVDTPTQLVVRDNTSLGAGPRF